MRHKLLDLSKFPDCSALLESGKCTRLTVPNCQGKMCTFKRTSKEDFDSIKCAYQRLLSLDRLTQSRIAQKYYKGFMPWNK